RFPPLSQAPTHPTHLHTSLAFGWFLPFQRRQRLHVVRHRLAILGCKLARVAHHVAHRTADGIAARRVASCQYLLDVAHRIVTDSCLRDVRPPILAAWGMGPAGEALAIDDCTQ